MNQVILLGVINHNYREMLLQNKPGEKDNVNNINSISLQFLRLLFLFGKRGSFPTNVLLLEGGSSFISSRRSPCSGSSEACSRLSLDANCDSSNKYLPASHLPTTIHHSNII